MLEEEMQKSGYAEEEIRERRNAEYTEKGDVEIRQRAFAGWLVTNAEFRQDCDAFRENWESAVQELGGFPQLPQSLMGEKPSPPPEEYREFYDDYRALCVTWGLDGLATWNLPRPMSPQLGSRSLHYLPAIQEAGITLFVPWYLLRDKNIQLDELAARIRMLQGPDHLKGWLDRHTRNFGYEGFAPMLEIFHLSRIVPQIAVSGAAQGKRWGVGSCNRFHPLLWTKQRGCCRAETETVRKVRQVMNRRLKLCVVPTEDQ